MRNASRSIYLSFHTALSIFARTVGAAPVLQNFSLIEKRALAKDISKGEAAGGADESQGDVGKEEEYEEE